MVEDDPSGFPAGEPIGPTVLVIDDDAMVRQALTYLLEEHGFGILTAIDGSDGLRKFRQHAPDIVLTDIIMPNKEGIELIIELRRERPDARIIAMSGSGRIGDSDLASLATKLGADAGLTKPFDDLQLIDTISALLGCAAGMAVRAAAE